MVGFADRSFIIGSSTWELLEEEIKPLIRTGIPSHPEVWTWEGHHHAGEDGTFSCRAENVHRA